MTAISSVYSAPHGIIDGRARENRSAARSSIEAFTELFYIRRAHNYRQFCARTHGAQLFAADSVEAEHADIRRYALAVGRLDTEQKSRNGAPYPRMGIAFGLGERIELIERRGPARGGIYAIFESLGDIRHCGYFFGR